MGYWLAALLCCLGMASPPLAAETEAFAVHDAQIYLKDKVYLLNAHVDYSLTDTVLEALHNGVPLTIELRFELLQERSWWWSETVAVLSQRYRLRYYALAQHYVLNNLNSGAKVSYQNLPAILQALGQIDALPLLDENLLIPGEDYIARLRVALDIESLPAPLRPLAYLSSRWRLTSDWYTWTPGL